MKIIILRQTAREFMKSAKDLEIKAPEGEWRYFKFISKETVLGIYQNKDEGLGLHADFFKYFLGQFTPEITESFSIQQLNNFEDFCFELNELLNNKNSIFDLSVSNLWIWSNKEKTLSLPPKLKTYLNFDS